MGIIWPGRNEGGRCLSLHQCPPSFTTPILPNAQSETGKEEHGWKPKQRTRLKLTEEVKTRILEQNKGRWRSVVKHTPRSSQENWTWEQAKRARATCLTDNQHLPDNHTLTQNVLHSDGKIQTCWKYINYFLPYFLTQFLFLQLTSAIFFKFSLKMKTKSLLNLELTWMFIIVIYISRIIFDTLFCSPP